MATISSDGYHVPVLLEESVGGLNIKPGGIYVDATYGGGGHSRKIMELMGEQGQLFGFDQDQDAEKQKEQNGTERHPAGFTFVRSNFRYLRNWMRYYGVEQIDGLLADLGVSSHHFDDATRGFSFRFNTQLDMRMNNRGGKTAADVLNTYSEKQLADLLYIYGELKNSRRLASAIVKARESAPITTSAQLLKAIAAERGLQGAGGAADLTRDSDYADWLDNYFGQRTGSNVKKEVTKLFQALRIEVNHEMDALRDLLTSAVDLLAPGGRLVVITYHSLEDRLVKNVMKAGNVEGHVAQDFFGRMESPISPLGKVITPTADELQRNPRSRSAKLRIGEKR